MFYITFTYLDTGFCVFACPDKAFACGTKTTISTLAADARNKAEEFKWCGLLQKTTKNTPRALKRHDF